MRGGGIPQSEAGDAATAVTVASIRHEYWWGASVLRCAAEVGGGVSAGCARPPWQSVGGMAASHQSLPHRRGSGTWVVCTLLREWPYR